MRFYHPNAVHSILPHPNPAYPTPSYARPRAPPLTIHPNPSYAIPTPPHAALVAPPSPQGLQSALRFTLLWGTVLSLVLILVWPLLALPATVFSENYFTFWIILALVWGWAATLIMIFLPVWEAKDAIFTIAAHMATCQATTNPSNRSSKRQLV